MTEKKTHTGNPFPPLPADDPLFKTGYVVGSKRPPGATYHGSVPLTDPRYQSGYNFLTGKSLSPSAEPAAKEEVPEK